MSTPSFKTPKIAIVYDRLTTEYGGAEHVLRALIEAFPQADLYTTLYTKQAQKQLGIKRISASFLQNWKLLAKHHKLLSPLIPLALEELDLSGYQVIISVSSQHAKAVITKPSQLHVCYLLSPTRYLNSHRALYETTEPVFSLPVVGFIAKKARTYLVRYDLITAHRPDYFIPISKLIALRTKQYYHQKTLQPLYPPVPYYKPKELSPVTDIAPYFLSASRLVAYKRVDLSIRACLSLKKKLLIVGKGEQKKKLIQLAGSKVAVRKKQESLLEFFSRTKQSSSLIWFLDTVSEKELACLYAGAVALLMPGVEDFGITALQAAHYGTPSIIDKQSGVAEVLTPPLAHHCAGESLEELTTVLQQVTPAKTLEQKQLKTLAADYSPESFTTQFRKVVYDLFMKKGRYVKS